nr:hypothetical protein [uncultured Lichenicoccus sp.]
MTDSPQTTPAPFQIAPSSDEVLLIEGCDYPGEAAEKIASRSGCGFWEAMLVVQTWEHDNDR